MWKMSGCYHKGRGHAKMKMPCQDRIAAFSRKGVKVVALADGAGSAAYSREGAQLVVTCATEYVAEHFDEMISSTTAGAVKKGLLDDLRARLAELSEELGCDFASLASTLLFAAVKKDKFILGHLGDGVIGYLKGDEIKVASKPDNGEYANTTYFVTSRSAYAKIRLIKGSLGEIDGFVLMSDGCAESFYYGQENRLVPVTARILKWNCILNNREFKKILSQMFREIIVKKTTDDCSMIMLSNDYRSNPLQIVDEAELSEISHYASLDKKERRTSDVIG